MRRSTNARNGFARNSGSGPSRSVAFRTSRCGVSGCTAAERAARPTGCGSICVLTFLAADYSHVLQGRYVTLHATPPTTACDSTDSRSRAGYGKPHGGEQDTELDPRICQTDTHGYTDVVMATAALLGFELAPRIRDIHDQKLHKLDHSQHASPGPGSSPVQLKRTG
jgi:hypothetical protein